MSTPAFENAQRSAQLCETTDVLPNDELQTQLATLPNSLSKTHHLLKHQLPEGDVSHHFGTSDLKCIVKIINKMGQRELQVRESFVYCGQ